MATDFDATVDGLNFDQPAAVNTINQWASDNTNKRIPKVIDEISPETVMFLMNALYFKGDWSYKFNKANTSDRYFMLDNGTEIQTPTMDGKVKVNLHYGDGFSAMEMPYGRKNFSMVIVMPEGKLKDFYPDFTPQLWDEITTSLSGNNWTEILVNLPRFKFEYEKVLNDQLKALGMEDAFVPYVADLSGISDEELFVSFVKQNTFVEVNEEGTEAAAVTTIGVDVVSMPPHFFANKPFIFAIRERTTNTLLFMGTVMNPSL
jgi:serpin B